MKKILGIISIPVIILFAIFYFFNNDQIKLHWTGEEKLIFNCKEYGICEAQFGWDDSTPNPCGKSTLMKDSGVCFPPSYLIGEKFYGIWIKKNDKQYIFLKTGNSIRL